MGHRGYTRRKVPAEHPCWTDEDGRELDAIELLDRYGFRVVGRRDGFVVVDCTVVERDPDLPGVEIAGGYRARRHEGCEPEDREACVHAIVYRRTDGRSLRAEVGRERGRRPPARPEGGHDPEDCACARERADDPDHPATRVRIRREEVEAGDIVERETLPAPMMAEPDRAQG